MTSVMALARIRSAATPARLIGAMAMLVVLAVLAGGTAFWAAGGIRDAAQTIGRDAEPSVALALRMAATLADLDALAAADSLTDGGATVGTSSRFRAGLDSLAADLVAASRNITYGDAEALPLRALARQLLRYEEAVVETRAAAHGDPWLMAHRLEWASRVDRGFVVPEAGALAAANADELERRYAAYRATSLVHGGVAFAAFVLLVAVQFGAQVWLARRMRRLVNPLLALAMLVTAAGGLWLGAAVLSERADLRAAKSDAYDSLRVLFEAKAAVNALRAGMSVWLLDPAARPEAQQRMGAAATALIGTDLSRPERAQPLLKQLRQSLALESAGSPAAALEAAPHPGGLLGAELENVTFGVPEREAATESVATLAAAVQTIRAITDQESRDRTSAIGRWLGEGAGGGAGAFQAVQAALDRTIAVNQVEFERRVTRALDMAALIPLVACGALAAAALLSVGGLWLRLREYR